MPKPNKTPETLPQKRCKYCTVAFTPPNTVNGKRQQFCSTDHQKAYWRSGKLAFPKLVERITKEVRKALLPEMRELLRQELTRHDWQRNGLLNADGSIVSEIRSFKPQSNHASSATST